MSPGRSSPQAGPGGGLSDLSRKRCPASERVAEKGLGLEIPKMFSEWLEARGRWALTSCWPTGLR